MTDDESLSDKRTQAPVANQKGEYLFSKDYWYPEKDVKEAVKKLKEDLCEQIMMDCGSEECGTCNNCKKIDKIFGSKLIE